MQHNILALLAEEAALSQEALSQALVNYPTTSGDPSNLLFVIDSLSEAAIALEITEFLDHTNWISQNILELVKLYPNDIPETQQQLLNQWLVLFTALFKNRDNDKLRQELSTLILSDNWLVICPATLAQNIFTKTQETPVELPIQHESEKTIDLSAKNDIDPRLWNAFMEETPQQATMLIQLLRGDLSTLKNYTVENMAHTIKGGANLVGIPPIAQLASCLENIFEGLEEQSIPDQRVSLLQQASDILEAQFMNIGQNQAPIQTDPSSLLSDMDEWVSELAAHPTADQTTEDWIDLRFASDIDPRLIDAFYQETPDIVYELTHILSLASQGEMVGEKVTEAQRLAHTLKGSASLLGISSIENLAHKLEDAMELLEDTIANPELSFTLLETGDLLESMFDALLNQETGINASMSNILSHLAQFVDSHSSIPEKSEFDDLLADDDVPALQQTKIDLSPDKDLHPLLWDAFMQETPDLVDKLYLQIIENCALLFGENAHQAEILAHTIKGAGKLVSIDAISSLTYILEEIFELLAATSASLEDDKQAILYQAADILQIQFTLIGQTDAPKEADPTDVIEHLSLWKTQLEQGSSPNDPIIPETSSDDSVEWINLTIPTDVDSRLVAAFFEEAPDQASELSGMLQAIMSTDISSENIVEAQRLAHTVKGSAALLGLPAIEHLTHRLEDVMEGMEQSELNPDLSRILLEAGDLLESMFDALLQQETGISANLQHILSQLDQYIPDENEDQHDYVISDIELATNDNDSALFNFAKPDEINPLLWDAFLAETPAQASHLISLLIAPEEITQEVAKQAEQLIHTIKGACSLIGIRLISDLASVLESIFEQLHDKQPNEFLQEQLLLSADILDIQFSAIGGQAPQEANASALIKRLNQALEALENHTAEIIPSSTPDFQITQDETQVINRPSYLNVDEDWTDLSISAELDPRLIEAFFMEAPDQAIELSIMLQGELNKAQITEAQRLAHTIKGSAALLGITSIESLSHQLEDVMEGLEGTPPSPELTELFLETGDFIASIFDALIAKKDRINRSSKPITEHLAQWAKKLNPEKLAHDEGNEDNNDEGEFTAIAPSELLWNDKVDPDLIDQFFMDAPENVEQLSNLLLNNQISTDKGLTEARTLTQYLFDTSQKIGIKLLHNFSHNLKLILNNMRSGQISDAGLTVLEDAGNILTNIFNAIQGINELDDDISSRLWLFGEWASRVASQNDDTPEQETAPKQTDTTNQETTTQPKAAKTASKKTTTVATTLRVPTERIDALIKLVGEMTTAISQLQGRLNNSINQVNGIQIQSERTSDKLQELETLIVNKHSPDAVNEKIDTSNRDFDPLEMDQYHELNSISSFLNESFSDSQKMAQFADDELTELNNIIHLQERLSREVNEAVLATRMLSVDQLTPRLERAVREASRASGKKANLDIIGEELLIDTDIINGIRDPLMHLLRNSVDHGIEKPQDREAAGKNPVGTIRTSFLRQGNTILVNIQDDGAGFNLERIKKTAAAKGLKISDAVSETEILRLILQPGFSTKENVTKLSGRGIGMDVVAQAVSDLNGTIKLSNRKDAGSEITLRLPLTLVSAPVLLVKSVEQIFSIPGDDIHQILFPEPDSIYQDGEDWYFKHVDNKYYLHSLNALLGREDKEQALKRHKIAPIILVHDEYEIQAVALDLALERRDVVIQRLGRWLPNVPGVSGACILADGSISPILDLKSLLHNPNAIHLDLSLLQDEARLLGTSKQSILVVDDSLSARLSLQLAVEQAGYEALTAIDGLNAIDVLTENSPIAVVTDMEMPRMNGLELTRHIKNNPASSHLPVVMITSRSTAKHRQQAKDAGVNRYLTKPFDNNHLHKVIQELTEQEDSVTAL